jgi:hypothetical protein
MATNRCPFDRSLPLNTKRAWEARHRPELEDDDTKDELTYRVDLVAFEESLQNEPVFSRERIQKIKDLQEEAERNAYRALTTPDIQGQDRIV